MRICICICIRTAKRMPDINAKKSQAKTEQADLTDKLVITVDSYDRRTNAVTGKAASPNLNVTIVDGARAGAWKKAPRASAIAAAASRMLNQLGCWEEILPEAEPITEMVITDSRTSDPVRPVFLTFDG